VSELDCLELLIYLSQPREQMVTDEEFCRYHSSKKRNID
jgi:hypothetical protein